jgi:hypothetical protein
VGTGDGSIRDQPGTVPGLGTVSDDLSFEVTDLGTGSSYGRTEKTEIVDLKVVKKDDD